jgi:hypothetical protein
MNGWIVAWGCKDWSTGGVLVGGWLVGGGRCVGGGGRAVGWVEGRCVGGDGGGWWLVGGYSCVYGAVWTVGRRWVDDVRVVVVRRWMVVW